MQSALGYNGWWQFEEGFSVAKGNPTIRVLYKPTQTSYGTVELDKGAGISNSFIVSQTDHFILDIYAATVTDKGSPATVNGNVNAFTVYVDGIAQTQKRLIDTN
jgi:hypothetical protein